MRESLPSLIETAELALASASEVIAPEDLEPLSQRLESVRLRMSFPEDVLVVALAGGTGSGKSSLFNALIGSDVVDVGGVRPTTSHPAATVPRSLGRSLDGYLDHLGITERHQHQGDWLCLIDLPDTDSVVVDHRHTVDRVLPLVDLVTWVIDPEKYRDARLHVDYLAPMAAYADQFLFVLNQTDRLDDAARALVIDDLIAALRDDGIAEPVVVAVAAMPPSGPPLGIERLRHLLETRRAAGDSVSAKLVSDLRSAATDLAERAGSPVDFDERAAEVIKVAAQSLVDGHRADASRAVVSFLDDLASSVGGPVGEQLSRLAADVPSHLERIGGSPLASPTRQRLLRRDNRRGPGREEVEKVLAAEVIRPARVILAKRAVAIASIAQLGVETQSWGRSGSS